MAPRQGTQILQLAENGPTWDYFDQRLQVGPQRTEGAFRAFYVPDLQNSPPIITLIEWTDLAYGKKRAKRPNNYPNYAAISHVWDPSDDTAGTASKANRPLRVKIKDKPYIQVLSWHGLVEAADAANQLNCTYLWLDFLCLDQVPRGEEDHEKALQISNMANIYKNAKQVICMLGGVSAVQSLDSKTSWMDRAWTLQEATLNWKRTWAYVKWPYKTNFVINTGGPRGCIMKFTPVKQQSANSLMLIRLYHLLEMPPLTNTTSTTPSLALPKGFKVVCLDGIMNTGRASYAAKNAMLSVYRGGTPELRLGGVWRAMLLRTATKPVDVVYSVMGLFNVQVDPYREDRNVQYLFNDLARKAAAIAKPDMGWLVVGGVFGSVGRLNRDQTSFLIPEVPDYSLKQKPPRYFINGNPVLSGNIVDDSRYGISKYHIEFHTNSLPHIMCAVMLKVTNIKNKATLKRYKTASSTIGGKRSQCKYHGTIYNGITAMMVGTVGSWGNVPGKHKGQQYVMFMEWTRNGWVLKGDGIVAGTGINDKWVSGLRRWHFTVGEDAQKLIRKWPCDGDNPPITTKRLPMSYGVLPMVNYGVDVGVAPRLIQWFGFNGEMPLSEEWRTFNFWNSTVPPKTEFDRKHHLWLVACSSANPPKVIDVQTTSRLYNFIYLPMEWTDVSLGGPGSLDALQTSLNMGLNLRTYLVAVRFTRYMIYLKSVPDKMQQRLNPRFTNTAVVSYSLKNKQQIINSKYVVTQVKDTIFLVINNLGSNNTEKQAMDPYSGFTRRLQNVTRVQVDWSKYIGVIPGTSPGEILWTDGILAGCFPGFPNDLTYKVVRRDPNTGAVIAFGLALANDYYFKLL